MERRIFDRLLRDFADHLAPPADWARCAKNNLESLVNVLSQHSTYELDRHVIVGGVAKGTSTNLKADIDAVIYYNDEYKQYDRKVVLAEWNQCLVLHTSLTNEDVRRTDYLLSFQYKGIKMDIVAIRNNVHGNQPFPEFEQMMNDFQEVRASRDPSEAAKELTLSTQSVKWMSTKHPDVVLFVRLAKFWMQTVLFDETVNGMSYIFENLAIKAMFTVEDDGDASPSFTKALERFLSHVRNMDSLNVHFNSSNGAWYENNKIPEGIRSQIPLLLDPINPYNNLLDVYKSVKAKFFKIFSDYAEETLKILNEISNNGYVDRSDVAKLFLPRIRPGELGECPELVEISTEIVERKPDDAEAALPRRLKSRVSVPDSKLLHFHRLLETLMLNVAAEVRLDSWSRKFSSPNEIAERTETFLEKESMENQMYNDNPLARETFWGCGFYIPIGRDKELRCFFKMKCLKLVEARIRRMKLEQKKAEQFEQFQWDQLHGNVSCIDSCTIS